MAQITSSYPAHSASKPKTSRSKSFTAAIPSSLGDEGNPFPNESRKPMILKRKMGVFVELALSEVFDFGFVWW
jgi:hypothetical protein